jgi:enoyl-CoA hydratase
MVDALGEVRPTAQGRVLVIEVDREAKRNAFTPKMFSELGEALTRLEEDDELWVGVVTYAGDHTTAGLDLPMFRNSMVAGGSSTDSSRVDPFAMKRRLTKPLVMAVQGACYTIGIEMLLAADIVVAAESCRFCQLEPKRGLGVFGGAAFRYVERAGWGNAMYHLLRADVFDARRALALGFVQEVVAHGEQKARALAIAAEVAANAPLALRWIKRAALAYVQEGEQASIDLVTEMMRATAGSEDAAEGLRSFLEKREPVFTGR